MKKFILFTVVLYVLFLVSFKENSRETEPFAKILKDNPERLQELLMVAATYKNSGNSQKQTLSDEDTLSRKQLDIFRNKKPREVSPVIVISTWDLNLLIKDHLNKDDSVVFYLGQYYKNDPKRIKRYNQRNIFPFTFGKDTLTYSDLKEKPAFAMQVFSNVYSKGKKPKHTSEIFKPQNILGSMGKGMGEFEKNNDGVNTVVPAKFAVSAIYEISRLCPPPPEGCF